MLQSEKAGGGAAILPVSDESVGLIDEERREMAAPALLKGIFRLLSAQGLFEFMTPEEIKERAAQWVQE